MSPEARSTSSASAHFLEWVDRWHEALPAASLCAEIIPESGPSTVAVLVVDLLVGFCAEGALASARVGALGPRAVGFLQEVYAAGVRHLLFPSDAHPENSPEFRAFPPHCIRGTREAEIIPELTRLPFSAEFLAFPKGSVNVGVEPAFQAWRAEHPEVDRWIVVGDCTDICVYQTAMYLRATANSTGQEAEIWVPANLVDTYDLPVDVAAGIGALPHDGELLHRLFLYHMALNGIHVVSSIGA